MRSLSYRRQQRQKALERAYKRAKIHLICKDALELWVRRSVVTPHSCSCWCCGNPRRHYAGSDKFTMQERRLEDVRQLFRDMEDYSCED